MLGVVNILTSSSLTLRCAPPPSKNLRRRISPNHFRSRNPTTITPALPEDRNDLTALADGPLLKVYAPTAVVLGTLMLIDAAYSGDWSRIGVITKQQELQLQSIIPFEAAGHSLCAVAAGAISAKRGEERWALRALKAFAGGIVSLIEVVLVPASSQARVSSRKL